MRMRWQLRLYAWLWGMIVAAGLAGLLRFRSALGRGFGGFIWHYEPDYGHHVSFEVPRHWPGPQAGLVPHTRILAVNNRPPLDFPKIYAQCPIGTPIIFDVLRQDGRHTQIRVALSRFTPAHLAEGYGMLFVIGLAYSTGGYLLTRSAHSTGRTLMGFVMLMAANSAFSHSYSGSIERFSYHPLAAALMGAATNGILGSLLVHLSLVYPRPLRVIRTMPWLVALNYALGLCLSTGFGLSSYYGRSASLGALLPLAQRASFVFLTFGALTTISRGSWELLRKRGAGSSTEYRQMQIIAVAWIPSAAVLLGILAAVNIRISVPVELLTNIAGVLSIGLVYAIYNADLIADLEEQSALRGELLAQLNELEKMREHLREEFADALHDSALAESKALEMRLYTLLRQTSDGHIEGAALRDALAVLHEQGVALGRSLRLTVEGAKPLDLATERLSEVLSMLISQLNAARSGTLYELRCTDAIDQADTSVQEAVYWIVRAALNNVRDHAQARNCSVDIRLVDQLLVLRIVDTGRGISSDREHTQARSQRQLGLRAIHMRVARLGGQCELESGTQGTSLQVQLPCKIA